jgi:hypothetical protein
MLFQVFVDSSYEGDLIANAGVSFTIGREPQDQYNESMAGRRHGGDGTENEFRSVVNPFYSNGTMLAGLLSHEDAMANYGQPGSGDNKVQGCVFQSTWVRTCMLLRGLTASRPPLCQFELYCTFIVQCWFWSIHKHNGQVQFPAMCDEQPCQSPPVPAPCGLPPRGLGACAPVLRRSEDRL